MPTLNPSSRVRLARRRTTRGRASGWALLAAIPLLVAITAPTPVAAATTDKTVTVAGNRRWTPTGVNVKTGDTITIDASGSVRFGPFPIDHISPAGQPRKACADLVALGTPPFTAPTLNCWSLIARIGTEAPRRVGKHAVFSATSDGELQLGVNDNQLPDNIGSWRATISVKAAAGGVPGSGSSSNSNTLLFVVIALVVVLLLLALFLVARRRRGEGDEEIVAKTDDPSDVILADVAGADDVPAAAFLDEPADQPIGEAIPSFAKAPGPLGTSVAPEEGEVPDTNIFEVEIANGTDLRVGYNYFPEDTDLHWQVRQGSLFAHGRFPTNGGGNMYHYVTLPLGVHLEPAPAAVDVQFTWSIGGVPFRYSVRRDPGL
jgi:type 1 fimbria pilin